MIQFVLTLKEKEYIDTCLPPVLFLEGLTHYIFI